MKYERIVKRPPFSLSDEDIKDLLRKIELKSYKLSVSRNIPQDEICSIGNEALALSLIEFENKWGWREDIYDRRKFFFDFFWRGFRWRVSSFMRLGWKKKRIPEMKILRLDQPLDNEADYDNFIQLKSDSDPFSEVLADELLKCVFNRLSQKEQRMFRYLWFLGQGTIKLTLPKQIRRWEQKERGWAGPQAAIAFNMKYGQFFYEFRRLRLKVKKILKELNNAEEVN